MIPCHRVISKVGTTHRYRWGATRKKAIPGREAGHLEQDPCCDEVGVSPESPAGESNCYYKLDVIRHTLDQRNANIDGKLLRRCEQWLPFGLYRIYSI